jgi:plastocyanin
MQYFRKIITKYFLLALLMLVLASAAVYQMFFSVSPLTVTLKEDGFHPRVLNVHAGETVTFKSALGKYFWPATDFHPTHSVFPSFDPKEPVSPEDTWSFTFEKPGVYKYHDHLAAYYFGIVRVSDANGDVPENCMQEGGEFGCWQNEVFFALAEKGVDAAYDAVSQLFNEEPGFAESCHGITHNIGLASYQFYRTNPDFIYSPNAIVCAAGFYHGFMEGYLGASGDIAGSARLCDEVGKRLGEETPDARLQCYHGVGHGAVETTIANSGSFGTRDEFVAKAIALCEQASTGVLERYRCVSGIYNGVANFYINSAYGLSVEKENPLLMCAAAKEEYKESCYGNMNSVILWAADNDFSEASVKFLAIPDSSHIPKSIEYLASLYAVSHMDDESFPKVLGECRKLPDDYRGPCVRGFVQGLLEHGNPGIEYKKALSFCRISELTAVERDACLTAALGSVETWYSKDLARSICAEATNEERAYCTE